MEHSYLIRVLSLPSSCSSSVMGGCVCAGKSLAEVKEGLHDISTPKCSLVFVPSHSFSLLSSLSHWPMKDDTEIKDA